MMSAVLEACYISQRLNDLGSPIVILSTPFRFISPLRRLVSKPDRFFPLLFVVAVLFLSLVRETIPRQHWTSCGFCAGNL